MITDAPIVVEPAGEHTASVIWLHGLGADGHDFEPLVPELGERVTAGARFVFPHAARIPVTVNGGMVMRAWYDIAGADIDARTDESGIRASAAVLEALIETEIEQGVSPSRIVLAGFSQGGAIALHTGLRYPQPLAGIMALSTYLPLADAAAQEAHESNRRVPLFLAHGSQDPVVPLGLSERSLQQMMAMGYAVECHTYPMQHAVCGEEIRDIANWLERVLIEH